MIELPEALVIARYAETYTQNDKAGVRTIARKIKKRLGRQ